MYQFDNAGNVTILIKAAAPMDLLGVSYQEDDVVAFFDNAYFDLQFINNNKAVTRGPVNLLHYNTLALSTITIMPKSTSHSTYNFIAARKSQDANFYLPVKETITSDANGVAFFTRIPTNQKAVYIKNSTTRVNVTGYTVDYSTGQITGLGASTSYLAFYYGSDVELISYSLEEVKTPYFKIEVLGENNTNNITRKSLIVIPKASIDISTLLEFKQETLAAVELKFSIVDGQATIVYY